MNAEEYGKMVWGKIAKKYPEFTRAYDSFGDPWAVETLVLGEVPGFKRFEGANVMDLGANVGIYTAFCAVGGCNVTAYEADPVTFATLLEMLTRTGLRDRVWPVNYAVWTYTGQCSFKGDEYPVNPDGIRLRNGAIQVEGRNAGDSRLPAITVPCLSFQEALGESIWDCIKVDIEGAEFDIFLNTPAEILASRIRYMTMEIHHAWADDVKYKAFMEKLESVFTVVGHVASQADLWAGRFHWAQFTNKVKI